MKKNYTPNQSQTNYAKSFVVKHSGLLRLVLFSFITLFFGKLAMSQCAAPTDATVSITNITCEGTGKVVVTSLMEGANSIPLTDGFYSLYDASNTNVVKIEQSNPDLGGLNPGTYVLHIRRACLPSGVSDEYTKTITISGSYTEPVLTVNNVTNVLCSNDGSITASATKGYGAYEFCLVDNLNAPGVNPTYTVPRQSSGVFNNLTAGDYYVRVYDQCQGFVTQKVTITAVPPTDPISTFVAVGEDCSKIVLKLNFARVVPRTAGSIWIRYPDGSIVYAPGTYDGNESSFDVPFSAIASYPATFTVYYKNSCGTVFSKDITVNQPDRIMGNSGIYNASNFDCTSGTFSINSPYWVDRNNSNMGSTAWQEYSTDGGLTWKPYDRMTFDTVLVDKGTSRNILFRGCGQIYTATVTMPAGMKPLDIGASQLNGMSCDGKSGIKLNILSYNGNAGKILVHVVSQPAEQPAISDFLWGTPTSPANTNLMNLAPGAYVLQFTDECGVSITKSVTLTANQISFDAKPVFTCGSNKVAIRVSYTSSLSTNISYNFDYHVINSAGIIVKTNEAYNATTDLISNLDPGIYTVKLWVKDFWNQLATDAVCPQIFTVDANLPKPLSLSNSAFAVCHDNSTAGLIIAQPVGGLPPYTYTLYQNSVAAGNEVRPSQSSNVFTSLDPLQTYWVEVKDQCGAGATFTSTFGNMVPLVNTSESLQPCYGTSFTFSVNNTTGVTYQWMKDNVDIPGATSSSYTIGNVAAADAGTYSVRIDVGGCLVYSKGSELTPWNCNAPMPLTLAAFIGKRVQGNDQLSWSTETEVNTHSFEVEYSADGKGFKKIALIAAAGNSNVKQYYQYSQQNVAGDTWYRLKMADKDGSFTYSPVIRIRGNESVKTCLVSEGLYPVPFSQEVNLKLYSCKNQPVTLTLSDMSGRVQVQRQLTLSQGKGNYVLNNLGRLTSGIYLLRIQTQDGEIIIQKAAKQ